jgi:hypothetical protein
MYKYSCYEQELTDGQGNRIGMMAILFGGMNSQNPKAYMDNAVTDYLQKHGNPLHNQFVEIHMDNPWLRVIVIGINELPYHEETICF